ncbi:MAG: hypothetical protein OXD29_05475 [Roseovarius sp.]|nr:hypothetical protein [Roseovarius sp.]
MRDRQGIIGGVAVKHLHSDGAALPVAKAAENLRCFAVSVAGDLQFGEDAWNYLKVLKSAIATGCIPSRLFATKAQKCEASIAFALVLPPYPL